MASRALSLRTVQVLRLPVGAGATQQEDQWVEAYGPVITDPDHVLFRGAQVGSNNTGELTSILEALIYAIDHNWQPLTIC